MDMSQLTQWLMAGGIFLISGFSIATYVHVGQVKDDAEKKRTRVYDRMDEVKAGNDDKFTNKDVCKVIHDQLRSDIIEVKTDLKLLLRKNGINES